MLLSYHDMPLYSTALVNTLYHVGKLCSPPKILHVMMQALAKRQQERLISAPRPVIILFTR